MPKARVGDIPAWTGAHLLLVSLAAPASTFDHPIVASYVKVVCVADAIAYAYYLFHYLPANRRWGVFFAASALFANAEQGIWEALWPLWLVPYLVAVVLLLAVPLVFLVVDKGE